MDENSSTASETNELAVLAAAAGDAEVWLARWLSEQLGSGEGPDLRELNLAVTALRRLIDARKALREMERDESSQADRGNDPQALQGQFLEALERLEAGGAGRGDPPALPD